MCLSAALAFYSEPGEYKIQYLRKTEKFESCNEMMSYYMVSSITEHF